MSYPWIREATGAYRCQRHKTEFRPPEACPGCAEDLGEPIDVEVEAPLAKPPRGCDSTEQHERALTAIARFAERNGKAIAKSGKSAKTQNAASKWIELAVKARRAAILQAVRREDEEIVRGREKRQRARDRGATN